MQKEPQQIPSYMPAYQQDDEIDLFELWNILWKQKTLIIMVTFLVTMIAAGYLVVTKPVYKAEAFFLPPLQQDIQGLNMQGVQGVQGVQQYTIPSVYEAFLNNLQSRQLRQQFYNEHNLLAWYKKDREIKSIEKATIFQKNFYEKLAINIPKKNNTSFVSLSFELDDAAKSAEWLNQYIDFVASQTQQQLIQSLTVEVESKKTDITDKMASIRAVAQARRLDRVVRLQEALEIAKAAGIKDSGINQAANGLNMDYMRGIKAIDREIQLLNARKSDDPFIGKINDLKQQYSYLGGIKIDAEAIRVVRLDQVAVEPEKAVKPKKLLVISIAILLGGMLGIFAAFIRNAVKKRKEDIDAVTA